ncbi:MAG: aminotransferase class V-fold PLP-dependent enzyme [Phycisphaerales bacterium]|nr:aminotransferase class V-fold PLP-dependent enzyme [Phycisphaerales bacterium]
MTSSSASALIADRPPKPLPGSGIESWTLSEEITFLNHGSFGGRPRAVAEAQQRLKETLDSDPFVSIWLHSEEQLLAARTAVASFVGADPGDLVNVVNATDAINAVARSLSLDKGQSVVTTGHGYNAVTQTLRHVANRAGAELRVIDLHPPLPDEAGLVEAFAKAIDDTTAFVMVDHVSSPTAMLFPVEEIVRMCRSRGVPVMVDGAHAPGMFDLDVEAIGADFYTGNLHKWVSAPTGAAFLHVSPEHQSSIHPTIISHYYSEGFQPEFRWLGTRDTTAFLAAPMAIDWFRTNFSWEAVQSHNRQLVSWATGVLCDAWQVEPLDVPESSAACSMRTIALPGSLQATFNEVEDWRDWLRRDHRLDVAVHDWAGQWWVRLSAHIYNRPEDYQRLIDVGLSFDSR